MKKLILIRHSKSSWESPVDDFNRKLTTEGVNKAIKVALNTNGIINRDFKIFSSDATRAAQTAQLFVENWDNCNKNISYDQQLYTFSLSSLELFVKNCPNSNLILFGHNHAITDFVNKFGNIFIDNVPTAGFISINFDIQKWEDLRKGTTQKIIFPRDI